ncbi:bifunctional diaminohydroxyphosphoribosylaminopyrimidine deaminase/5-amino-6-(5-phosphoribosylamino)uracil reductase RibD [Thiomicrospira sp. WB1]|uniref:bifunctional diaminohydroxyphosphoribosylaminopyrimidine deaminase/5-amino-6-(5-phosphoribosylamino)uracil reductase RibD n=1 Tax=Thiomicrospira sp. WB1 TaxID=1685380 RepID=UPI0007497AAB|nr:bifunctional diaminohydroxyphosphoribosylaminopyrimidine deaminase/5-amino-6-(5-phosphoribosylamino)uracil reductase RibD [Thiomicrospira sp. WB1]KUJ71718.1 bifunctional diaminohydroxyphosphoribosylaminopyrimidine deaminase/5-amino-6-(5-phosphoribosylamino)uracil reductase [Thiomicrospira sp. WB1]
MTAFSELDHRMMRQALSLAKKGRYTALPNPAVGCVIAHHDRVVAQGWHAKAGALHAEAMALAEATESVAGATVYVTLEPCSHFGRTPPCADALVAAKVGRVVVAMTDPNPQVAGNGLQRLQEAGIEVAVGLLASEAEALNREFLYAMRQQRPFVRTKIAMSLDAKTAMASGESKWITGEDARHQVHRLRAQHQALLTGVETVLADDPSLNVRLPEADCDALGWHAADFGPEAINPVRIVLDSSLRFPELARMLSVPGETWVVTTEQAYEASFEKVRCLLQAGARVFALPSDAKKQVSLSALWGFLHREHSIRSVLVEAGARLNGALLQQGGMNEAHLFIAPVMLGSDARDMAFLPGLVNMDDRLAFEWMSMQPCGADMYGIAVPKSSQE